MFYHFFSMISLKKMINYHEIDDTISSKQMIVQKHRNPLISVLQGTFLGVKVLYILVRLFYCIAVHIFGCRNVAVKK